MYSSGDALKTTPRGVSRIDESRAFPEYFGSDKGALRMDKSKALAVVSTFSEAISNTYRPVKVVLYGSYARGDQHAYSDIDVVVYERAEG
jgi:predicted nucleotidyltransferase